MDTDMSDNLMNQKDIISAYAEIYLTAIPIYRKALSFSDKKTSTKRFKSELHKSLKWLIKHCGTLIPPKASKAAIEIAEYHRIDLFALQWKDQPAAEKLITGQMKRSTFIHEHEIPIHTLYEKIINANDVSEITSILNNQSIVWITRKEEKSLHPYIRTDNSYKENGIIVQPNTYGDEWMEHNWKK
jgi:hypothetical protein